MKTFITFQRDIFEERNFIKEVKGFNISDRCFSYKSNEDDCYYLIDKKSGYSLGKFSRLKDVKKNYKIYEEKLDKFILSNERMYYSLVDEFNKLKGGE